MPRSSNIGKYFTLRFKEFLLNLLQPLKTIHKDFIIVSKFKICAFACLKYQNRHKESN